MLKSTGFAPYLATASTQTTYSLDEGPRVVSSNDFGGDIVGGAQSGAASHRIVQLGGTNGRLHNAWRGAQFIFIGQDAADEAINYKLWGVNYLLKNDLTTMVDLALLGSGVATLGAKTGVDGAVIDDSDLIADTLTWTASAFLTDLITAYGATPAVHSPADDTIARLMVPDFCGADGFIMEFDVDTALNANVLYRLMG